MAKQLFNIPTAPDLKGLVDDDILAMAESSPMLVGDLVMLMNIRVNLELIDLIKEIKERAENE